MHESMHTDEWLYMIIVWDNIAIKMGLESVVREMFTIQSSHTPKLSLFWFWMVLCIVTAPRIVKYIIASSMLYEWIIVLISLWIWLLLHQLLYNGLSCVASVCCKIVDDSCSCSCSCWCCSVYDSPLISDGQCSTEDDVCGGYGTLPKFDLICCYGFLMIHRVR